MTHPTLLVLAAGLGSRYGGLKQLDPVGPGGETILDYSIYDATRAGFRKVVFVIRRDIEQTFRRTVGSHYRDQIAVDYVFQEIDGLPSGFSVSPGRTKPWGTAHAVLAAANTINEAFGVINADDFYGTDSYRALAQHLQADTASDAMIGFELRNTLSNFGAVSRGLCRTDACKFLQSIVELRHIKRDGGCIRSTDDTIPTLIGDEVVSMNMWGFTPAIFEHLQKSFDHFLLHSGHETASEFYLPGAINELLLADQIRVRVLPTPDSWFGITHREDRPGVVENLRLLIHGGLYPERLW